LSAPATGELDRDAERAIRDLVDVGLDMLVAHRRGDRVAVLREVRRVRPTLPLIAFLQGQLAGAQQRPEEQRAWETVTEERGP